MDEEAAELVPAEMVLLAGRESHTRYDRPVEYAFPEANDEVLKLFEFLIIHFKI